MYIFKDTMAVYRKAVDYLIDVCSAKWDELSEINGSLNKQRYIETLVHAAKDNNCLMYDFDRKFYKMPSYLTGRSIDGTF